MCDRCDPAVPPTNWRELWLRIQHRPGWKARAASLAVPVLLLVLILAATVLLAALVAAAEIVAIVQWVAAHV